MAVKKAKKTVMMAVGKRKKAIARAVIRKGSGKIRINRKPIDLFDSYRKMRILEAVVLAGDHAKDFDIDVSVKGGGMWGQADAARTAIANAILMFTGDPSVRSAYLEYDRSLLRSDPRRTEPHKPSRSTAGPRRTKQQSKR